MHIFLLHRSHHKTIFFRFIGKGRFFHTFQYTYMSATKCSGRKHCHFIENFSSHLGTLNWASHLVEYTTVHYKNLQVINTRQAKWAFADLSTMSPLPRRPSLTLFGVSNDLDFGSPENISFSSPHLYIFRLFIIWLEAASDDVMTAGLKTSADTKFDKK